MPHKLIHETPTSQIYAAGPHRFKIVIVIVGTRIELYLWTITGWNLIETLSVDNNQDHTIDQLKQLAVKFVDDV